MNFFWLNKQNNKNLILFMNGWGMDESVVKHLDFSGFDILCVNDYRKFDFNYNDFEFEKYQKKYLVCWSMGVYVSNLYKNVLDNFDKKIAIAGTNKIIDNNFGIPNKIYNYTVKFFNNESSSKFISNMFQDEKFDIKINKTIEDLKEELISIQNLKIIDEIKYNKAIIPKKDTIVPYKNQMNYWENKETKIIEINSAHFVFNHFKTWQEIIC